jgi:hypothetical protein
VLLSSEIPEFLQGKFGILSKTREWFTAGNWSDYLKVLAKLRCGEDFLLKQESCEVSGDPAARLNVKHFRSTGGLLLQSSTFCQRIRRKPGIF